MDTSFIDYIPEILLWIIPGYIMTLIIETFTLKKHLEKYEIVLHSLLYSFILNTIYLLIGKLSKLVIKKNEIFDNTLFNQVLMLILSILIGFIFVKFILSKVNKTIYKLFNKSMSPETTVWIKAMDNPKGAWARVYLKNGLVYTGTLRSYTNNPNDNNLEILLYRYKVESFELTGGKNAFNPICDNTDQTNSKALIKRDDIYSIEIFESH